jgi:hypothetical protein
MKTFRGNVTEILLTELLHCRHAFKLDLSYHIYLMHFANLQVSYHATVTVQRLHLFCTAQGFYTCKLLILF